MVYILRGCHLTDLHEKWYIYCVDVTSQIEKWYIYCVDVTSQICMKNGIYIAWMSPHRLKNGSIDSLDSVEQCDTFFSRRKCNPAQAMEFCILWLLRPL